MDLSTMMSKIDQHKYRNVQEFLDDVDLITRNALEYNPDRDQTGTGAPLVAAGLAKLAPRSQTS